MRSDFRISRLLSWAFGFVFLLTVMAVGLPATAGADQPVFARMITEDGNILMVLYPELAPHHVANFEHLARTGFYDGTRFHRIIQGFMIQGGDPNSKDSDPRNDGQGGPTLRDVLNDQEWQTVEKVNAMLEAKGYAGLQGQANLKAEFTRKVKHTRGTLSMARGRDPNSAGSQFFICVDNTPGLDGQYTIFGHVVSGMDVADVIVSGEKNPAAGQDAPAIPVVIRNIEIFEGTDSLTPEEAQAWQDMAPELKSAP